MMPDKKQIESTLEWFDSYVFPMLQANAEDVCNSNVIRTILQSALDTQKPAGDAAEALDWFNGILDVFHSKYEATEPDKEAELISTIRAALDQMQAGDVEALKRPEPVFEDEYSPYRRGYERGKQLGWNDCLDHLHAQGYLSAKLPKIDGLDDALEYYGPDNAGEMRLFDTTGEDFTRQFNALHAAARAYRERME